MPSTIRGQYIGLCLFIYLEGGVRKIRHGIQNEEIVRLQLFNTKPVKFVIDIFREPPPIISPIHLCLPI
jgi:hypothetical protein